MIIRRASQIGEPVIRKKVLRVKDMRAAKTKKIVRDLVDSMRFHQLVGMAAPQIGIGAQIFVTEIRKTATRKKLKQLDGLRVYINPRIIHTSKKQEIDYEGCGSVAQAQLFAPVRRPASVTIQAFDEEGKLFVLEAKGLLGRVIQHEYDHLQGKVFLDRVESSTTILDRQSYIQYSR